MNKWKIAWRSIQQRGLASALTGFSMALGVMLVVAVLVLHGVITDSFLNNSALGYNMVIGAKGGRLDLVLNTVYYLARPVENIPYSFYQDLKEGELSKYVGTAIPICLGDTFQDFRVVGTSPGFLDDLTYGDHKYTFADGRNFKDDEFFGAVLGATVARETGLKVGDKFQPSHSGGPEAVVHNEKFTVLGVLEPTGTPNDRAVIINMEGFYLIPEHRTDIDLATAKKQATEGTYEPVPLDKREVTGVLVMTAAVPGTNIVELSAMSLMKVVNEGNVAQAVLPIREMRTLFTVFVDPLRIILLVLTVMIVIVSGIGILVSIYNSMSERQHEIAVMRALGAGRQTVMLLVLMESILLSLAGGLAGWIIGHGLIALLSPWIAAQTGVSVGFFQFVGYELVIIPGLILLATLVGYLPALAAYRTDVAKALQASP
jgi:putative ABC transport system permease protein